MNEAKNGLDLIITRIGLPMKKLLPLIAIFGFMVNNVASMNQPQRKPSCTICDSIKLDDFWQQVKNGRISKDEAKEELKYKELKLWREYDKRSNWIGFDNEIDLLLNKPCALE